MLKQDDLLKSVNFTRVEILQEIFGSRFYGPDAVCELYGKTFERIYGIQMSYMVLKKFADAGFTLMYMPAISIAELLKVTASKIQKDGTVMFYPKQFYVDGSVHPSAWFKDLNGINFAPYLLEMKSTKPHFILFKPLMINRILNKKVSAQLLTQKEYLNEIFEDELPGQFKLAYDSLTPQILNCIESLEVKDWKSVTSFILSLPFVQTYWADLVTEMFQFATLSSLSFDENLITHRGKSVRVKSPAPNSDSTLVFGRSEKGAFVGYDSSSISSSNLGLFTSLKLDYL